MVICSDWTGPNVPKLGNGRNVALDIGGTLIKLVYKVKVSNPKAISILKKLNTAQLQCLNIFNLVQTALDPKESMQEPPSLNSPKSNQIHGVHVQKIQDFEKATHLFFNEFYMSDSFILKLRHFDLDNLMQAIEFIKELDLDDETIGVTGGGAVKYAKLLQEHLGTNIIQRSEMESICLGVALVEANLNHGLYINIDTRTKLATHVQPRYPYLIVNVGSGISILKISNFAKYERITGTCLGGGLLQFPVSIPATAYGLVHALVQLDSFDKLIDHYKRGDNSLDKITKNHVTAGSKFEKGPNIMYTSFGNKTFNARPENVTRSIMDLISYNIGILTLLVARQHGISRVFLTGNYSAFYDITIDAIVAAMKSMANVYEGLNIEIFVPLVGGYIGAIGKHFRVILYVVSNDGDNWDTPNAVLIPTNSPVSIVTLADFKRAFSLPGEYHFRCKSEAEYKLGLLALNHFYNFGRQLGPQGIDKLLLVTLQCGQLDAAIKTIETSVKWLSQPPRMQYIKLLLMQLLANGNTRDVCRLFTCLRNHWYVEELLSFIIS
ncbi:bifunctional DIX domain/Type II pantothenate kinase/ATPase [Babesia duncani]|uniref:Bifunctional DIX domain/Type II pantothenate kinase/ATPase n=1 Tax=Babesia duncani TaxID=323732 RepID=A0AAD9UQX5_9APIC|nr:bifunctional DIX domain/Type II pantothenate kinase/ATPase [Babesia duncani]